MKKTFLIFVLMLVSMVADAAYTKVNSPVANDFFTDVRVSFRDKKVYFNDNFSPEIEVMRRYTIYIWGAKSNTYVYQNGSYYYYGSLSGSNFTDTKLSTVSKDLTTDLVKGGMVEADITAALSAAKSGGYTSLYIAVRGEYSVNTKSGFAQYVNTFGSGNDNSYMSQAISCTQTEMIAIPSTTPSFRVNGPIKYCLRGQNHGPKALVMSSCSAGNYTSCTPYSTDTLFYAPNGQSYLDIELTNMSATRGVTKDGVMYLTNFSVQSSASITPVAAMEKPSGVPEVSAPTGALPYKFYGPGGKHIFISKGNLQYQASTSTWRFAENQHDYIGNTSGNTTPWSNRSTQSDWIDLFCYGASGLNGIEPWDFNYGAHQPAFPKTAIKDTSADWGANAISNGGNKAGMWRTPTAEEMQYWTANGHIVDVAGIGYLTAVTPIDYQHPADVPSISSNVEGTVLTRAQYDRLCALGVLFLPMPGSATATDGVESSDEGQHGDYWASTLNSSSKICRGEFDVYNGSYSHYLRNATAMFPAAVRLVCDYEANKVVLEKYGVAVDGEYLTSLSPVRSDYNYDNATKTLTLKGTMLHSFTVMDNVNVVLDGDVVVTNLNSGAAFKTNGGTITFKGTGTLTAAGNNAPAFSNADDVRFADGLQADRCTLTSPLVYITSHPLSAVANPFGTGKFSVSATKQVRFAKTNLLYNSLMNDYTFAPEVTAHGATSSNGSPIEWQEYIGADGFNCKETQPSLAGYELLTADEWDYLFSGRTNASAYKGVATVHGVKGYAIAPDGFKNPLARGLAGTFDDSEWKKMEEAGVIFLPFRSIYNGSSIDNEEFEVCFLSGSLNDAAGEVNYVKINSSGQLNRNLPLGTALVTIRLVRPVSAGMSDVFGDINDDGQVTISDVNALVDYLLKK